jgi:hypothetical protein
MIGEKKPMSVSRYMHGGVTGVLHAPRGGPSGAMGHRPGGARLGRRPDPDSNGTEPRDPLEILLLAGDRDEYVDRSFWHDAEADGVTFQESRVDGRWNNDGGEWWK